MFYEEYRANVMEECMTSLSVREMNNEIPKRINEGMRMRDVARIMDRPEGNIIVMTEHIL